MICMIAILLVAVARAVSKVNLSVEKEGIRSDSIK